MKTEAETNNKAISFLIEFTQIFARKTTNVPNQLWFICLERDWQLL